MSVKSRTVDASLRSILEVVDAARQAGPSDAGLAAAALLQLARLIPCDLASFCEFDVTTSVLGVDQECTDDEVTTARSPEPEPEHPFFRHYAASLSCSYASRTGDEVSITKRSDFYSDREWRGTPMYDEYFRDSGLDHEILCCLPSHRTLSRRLVFFRSGSRDFDERDRLVLALLRPHLAEVAALEQRPTNGAPDLTARQWELLHLVAAGHTNAEIATRLYVTTNTVRKHLENIFDRLQVATRTAAVARAFAPTGAVGTGSGRQPQVRGVA